LPPHIVLPGIAAAFAPAAGFLFAAEGAPDFSAAGAQVDIGDAAITAVGGKELFSFTQVVGENSRAEPLGHFVMIGKRLVQSPVGDEIEDGGEGLFMHDLHIVARGYQARANVAAAGVARPVKGFAAIENLAAFLARRREGRLHIFDSARVDQRPHKCAGFQRIANANLLVRADQAAGQGLANGLVQDKAPGSGASLARRANCAKQNRPHGKVQVGAGGDDNSIIAAQLQQRAPQAAGHQLGHVTAHSGRAGCGDERNPRVINQSLANRCPLPNDQAENCGINFVGAADPLGNLEGGNRRERSLAGGLPKGGIATDGGQRAVPRPDGHGKVEGGDDANNPQRVPLLHHAVARPL